jgi:hypothetical protein
VIFLFAYEIGVDDCMDANGMEKTMESELLSELKDKGRFFILVTVPK